MLEIFHEIRHSETTVSFYFSEEVDDEIVLSIASFSEFVRERIQGCLEVMACSTSLFIEFHITRTELDEVRIRVNDLLVSFNQSYCGKEFVTEKIELPVYYGEEVSPDLGLLAKTKDLSVSEVIELHSEAIYKVVSLGFAPGFAYLSGLNDRLMMPRMSVPKTVMKGSVGIADAQTAVYPKASPGGWVIIGNCPLDLFNVNAVSADKISHFKVGAEVNFVSISRAEYIELGGCFE